MKKNIKNIIFSFLTQCSLMFYLDTRYDFIISCIFFVLLYFFVKTDHKNCDKRTKIYSMITALVLSLILSCGNIIANYLWQPVTIVFNLENIIKFIIMFIGFSIMINRLIKILFLNIHKIKIFEKERCVDNKKFLLLWGLIFICWLPYFLRYFPARMSPDSFYVIHYANEGILSDLHTFGHTWFFGAFFHLGKIISGNLNIGIAFSTIAQMLILSLMFSSVIKYLYKKGLNKYLCFIIFCLYALSPLNGVYSVTLWRDILFGGSFAVICLYLFEYVNNNYKLSFWKIILLFFTLILMLFFRNNGIYIVIILLPLIIVFCKKNRLFTSIFGISIILIYFLIKGPVFNYFNVTQTKSIEAYSIPLQQIARVIHLNGNINDDELSYLNNIMDVNKVKESYSQLISDPIKNITNGNKISENKSLFLKNWLKVLLKNPQIYIESYLFQTIGYWYPSINYGGAGTSTQSFFEEEVVSDPVTSGIINDTLDIVTSKRIPLTNFVWSIGTYFILALVSFIVMLYTKKTKYLIVFLPIICLWGTIMISTPVFAELRYIYGLFTAIPILICIPFYNKEDKNEKN